MAELTVVRGDITTQHVDAIANAASTAMRGGGGVDGAIHRAGGPRVLADCIARFPRGLATGDAGWTTAGELPARWIIHTPGPNYAAGDHDRGRLVSSYRRVIEVALELGARSIAFPLISAGIYGWPESDAIDVAVRTLADAPASLDIRLVIPDSHRAARVESRVLELAAPTPEPGSAGAFLSEGPGLQPLRGDIPLYRALRAALARTPLPDDGAALTDLLFTMFERITGSRLDPSTPDVVRVERFSTGSGLSDGMVHAARWRDTVIPALAALLEERNAADR